jgi:hypothetical protein
MEQIEQYVIQSEYSEICLIEYLEIKGSINARYQLVHPICDIGGMG